MKRILRVLLIACMAACVFPAAAGATETHYHAVCADEECTLHTDNITWQGISDAADLTAIDADGNYYLTQDISLKGMWTVDKKINLCLNGNMIKTERYKYIDITSAGELSICDCSDADEGKLSSDCYLQEQIVDNQGIFAIYSGQIELTDEHSSSYAIRNEANGQMYMYGGAISSSSHGIKSKGSTELSGGSLKAAYNAIQTDGGELTVSGDAHVETTASDWATLHHYGGTVNVSGGTVLNSGGTSAVSFGLENTDMILNVSGGKISSKDRNTVYVNNSAVTVNITGGTIENTGGNYDYVRGSISGFGLLGNNFKRLTISGAPSIDTIYLNDTMKITIGEGGLQNTVPFKVYCISSPYDMTEHNSDDYSSNFTGLRSNNAVINGEDNVVRYVSTHTVKFDSNGGSGEQSSVKVVSGDKLILPENTFTAPLGKQFKGWSATSDGTVISSEQIDVEQSMTLYAIWGNIPAEQPEIVVSSGISVIYNAYNNEKISISVTEKDGYTYSYRWYNDSGLIKGASRNFYTIPSDLETGVYNYYCKVTAKRSDNGESCATESEKITVVVGKFVPTAADFNCILPTELIYDGNEKTATVEVSDGIEGMGAITVKYYDAEGNLLSGAPKAAGSYTVKIDVAEGLVYSAATDISDELWCFTINKQTVTKSTGSSVVTTYCTVTFETNGGSKIANKLIARNTKLTEPTEPTKDGYTFGGWYTDEDLTTEYDFGTKVTKAITLYAKWIEDETDDKTDDKTDDNTNTPDVTEWENPFEDVAKSDWYYEDVEYAVNNGLFNGITDTAFAPNSIITRAMMVTVLYRAENEPEVTGTTTFEDVDADGYYANALVWGQQNGIIKGYSETEFRPDENIIREQIAAIMFRYAQYKGMDTVTLEENLHFADSSEISEYAVSAMNWAVGTGLMKGKSTTTINPKDNATRAEIAAILHRFIEADK